MVWWFGCAYALMATVLFLVLVKPAPPATPNAALSSPLLAGPARVLRDRDVWLVSLAFACFVMATTSSGTFLPTYLSVVRGMPLAQAALLSSVIPIVTIFSCPAGSMLSDRIGSRKRPYIVRMFLHTSLRRI
jgi:nitrate/nitrite transporter NarK